MNTQKFEAFSQEKRAIIAEVFNSVEAIRRDSNNPIDLSFDEVAIESELKMGLDDLLVDLGIDPAIDSISAIFNTGDANVRYLIPEIIRKAIRSGLRSAPIWPNITSMEMDSSQKKMTMPYLNMSDAAPRKVNESETIPVGNISYGDKSVEVHKMGRGIKIPYEVVQFVSIDVISLFLEDFGIKLGHALDTLAINTLINGDQADGSSSAAVIGIGTPGTKVYKDFLKPWIRGSRMGRNFDTIIGSEDAALDTLDLPEFKDRKSGTTDATLTVKTPIPNKANYFVHGNVPANQEILLDSRFALIKMNVVPLLIESDKVISNQTLETYVSLTTGFCKVFLDSTLVLDSSENFATQGFPAYMDVDSVLNVPIN